MNVTKIKNCLYLVVLSILMMAGLATEVIAGELHILPPMVPVLHLEVMHIVLKQAKTDMYNNPDWRKYDILTYRMSCRDEGDSFHIELSGERQGVTRGGIKGSPAGMPPGLMYKYDKKTAKVTFLGLSP
jgi:hypothetical protein